MNEIAVRTHRGEYFAGDIIYGIIYLKVEDPETIEKIQLKISGTEMCKLAPQYGADEEGYHIDDDHVNDFLANPSSDKIMEHPMQVMTQKEILTPGSYRIPFQYHLRPRLPSTTSIQCPTDNQWEGAITYTIIVSASPALQATQSFVCLGSRPGEALYTAYREETIIQSCFCYDRGFLALTTELDQITYTTGSTARIKILVENKTSEEVKSVKYTLKRTTELQGWWISPENSDQDKVQPGVTTKANSSHLPTDSSILYAKGKQERVIIEAGIDVQTRNLGSARPKETSRWECDIRLVDQYDKPLPPTTRGKYLKIQYAILVEVSVPRANDLTVVIPMQYVQPQPNVEWEAWEPAAWMTKCSVHRAHEKIAVRNSTLGLDIDEDKKDPTVTNPWKWQ